MDYGEGNDQSEEEDSDEQKDVDEVLAQVQSFDMDGDELGNTDGRELNDSESLIPMIVDCD